MFQMNKTTEDIKKFKLLQGQSDSQTDQYRKEIEILKSEIVTMRGHQISQRNQDHDSRIMNLVDTQVKEYNVRINFH